MISRLLRVTLTEWKLFVTDRAAILLLVVAGLLYAFYYPTPYIYQTVSRVPVAVVDLDHSAKSRELTRMASAAQQIEVKAVYYNLDDAEKAMASEQIYGFMVIPEKMEKDLQQKKPVSVNIFTHGAYVMLHGSIGTAFSTCALTIGATNKVKQIALEKKVSSGKAMAMREPIPLSFQTMFNSTGSYSNYIVPSVLILILQQSMVIGIAILGGARPHRRFRNHYRYAAVENESLLYRYFGRFLAYFLHYCCFILFYHCVIYNLFEFPRRGELLPMCVFAVVFLSAVINFGMCVSQVFLHRESSMQLFLYLSIPILFLANFSWPSYLMPSWMVGFSYILPSTFAIPAWLSIEQMGADIYDVAPKLYLLGIQALVYLCLGLTLTFIRDKVHFKSGEM